MKYGLTFIGRFFFPGLSPAVFVFVERDKSATWNGVFTLINLVAWFVKTDHFLMLKNPAIRGTSQLVSEAWFDRFGLRIGLWHPFQIGQTSSWRFFNGGPILTIRPSSKPILQVVNRANYPGGWWVATDPVNEFQAWLVGGFKYFFFHPYLGKIHRFPFWLIFFKGVGSTTN